MQVKSSSGHLKMGSVNVGEGNNHMQMFQRDVGDRTHSMDLVQLGSGGGGAGATWGPSVKHTTDSKDLSLLESALRTPRYTIMNKDFAAMRVSSPGMNGVLCNSIYGDQVQILPNVAHMVKNGIHLGPRRFAT
jgi:hypothetical protein